jgi:hypothetical protein
MANEGRRIVDAARARGLTVRLMGGLAVREHCLRLDFCDRDYSDLDMVGLGRELTSLKEVFSQLGYEERLHVRLATALQQAQFVRACVHHQADGSLAHDGDHVDVFLDVFRMDHRIDLSRRLSNDRYTISVSDVLLTKLQVYKSEERDLRDMVTLLKDVPVADGEAGTIDAPYIARLCARDWGLFYDVTRNVQRCLEALAQWEMSDAERASAQGGLTALTGAIDAEPKSLSWRLRAAVGTRASWHEVVEEQDGVTDI